MTHSPDDAVGQQAGQGAVNGCVGLAEDGRQFRRINERHLAEGVQDLSSGEGHVATSHALGSELAQRHVGRPR